MFLVLQASQGTLQICSINNLLVAYSRSGFLGSQVEGFDLFASRIGRFSDHNGSWQRCPNCVFSPEIRFQPFASIIFHQKKGRDQLFRKPTKWRVPVCVPVSLLVSFAIRVGSTGKLGRFFWWAQKNVAFRLSLWVSFFSSPLPSPNKRYPLNTPKLKRFHVPGSILGAYF